MDYQRYQSNMIYAVPDPVFTDDVVGQTGLGMEAEEYLGHPGIFRIQGIEQLNELVKRMKAKEKTGGENNDGENSDGEVGRS